MAYRVVKDRPRLKGEVRVVPARDDGSPFEWVMRFSGGGRLCYFDDVIEAVGVLTGEPAYAEVDEQARLVARIRTAIRLQVATQAALVLGSQQRGDWDRLTAAEREVLMAPRHEQPFGWSRALLGFDAWTARECPLVVLTTDVRYGVVAGP
ncbi:hypothetical protein AB0N29_17705 [Nocardioides sp. NPDC092400]|uniref:hypothetical protein n=1 Tax=Nocardioides sp. NPDC092400 TaxID=3155196 RepID=UPI00341A552A